MIGTHNSFTYLKASNNIFNSFKKFWKCQNLSIDEQYKLGVRFFDVRLYLDGDKYKICHQNVEFDDFSFIKLSEISSLFRRKYKGAKLRIIFDKGDIPEFFITEAQDMAKSRNYTNIDSIGAFKNNWLGVRKEYIIYKEGKLQINEIGVFHVPDFDWWNPVSLVKLASKYNIEKKAKSNPKVTPEMVEDKNVVYSYDFIEYA